ncbi:PKD-like family lipoprotein [Pedobacter nyackensis]|uniref:PKD-like family protein n=1 Tax=Pedobacter nyackensis TaxID=475255 RepID=A0A1W2CS87_9SPHI|nr:PKD-like family lipoprotein [Pedobacter nyackensis]SMC88109.1 PKD-like family protein [Pedobacter nyackensis]
MKIYNYCFAVLAAIVLFLFGCAKDKGNYDYKDLSTSFVDTVAMPNTFFVKQNESIEQDAVSTPGTPGNLVYEWRLLQQSFSPDPATGIYFNKLLANTKKLSYKVVDAPGSYMLVLYVKDNANGGITQIVKMPFTIGSYASPGWMVLHGDNTSSDISIIVNNKLLGNLLPANTDYVQPNVFSETNGAKIQGEGANVIYMSNHWVDVFTKTDQGGYRISGDDLRIKNTYSNMFINPLSASDIQYQAYAGWSYNELLINKGSLYFVPQPTPSLYYQFGVRCFGEDYVAAPFIGTIFNFSYYGVIYDMKNKRFLYIDFQRYVKQFKEPGLTAKFNMRNVGKEMVYAEHGFAKGWFCVMQDEGNPNSRELFICNFDKTDDGNRALDRINISNATDLNNAKYFSIGNRANVMYYATDTKIYQNNYAGDLFSTQRYDISVSYPGNVITGMKLLKVNLHPNDGKILYVALYNPTTKAGTLLQIDVNEVSGVFGAIKAYTGFGKISGMNYKIK